MHIKWCPLCEWEGLHRWSSTMKLLSPPLNITFSINLIQLYPPQCNINDNDNVSYISTQLDIRSPKMIQLSLIYVISSECNVNHNQTRELASTTTPLCRQSNITGGALTKHLGDVWFDVDVLKVLVGVSMVEAKSWVESDAHPHPVPNPSHLAHLRLLARVCIKCFLYGRVKGKFIDI